MLTRRSALRLAGLGVGAIVAACGALALDDTVPKESDPGGRLYDYAYLRDKYKSPSFMAGNCQVDSLLCFGSSEFKITPDIVAQVPQAVLGGNDHGLDLWFVGEGYDQSLWHAIAMGAYAAQMDENPAGAYASGGRGLLSSSRKAVLVISPQWFFEGGVPANAATSLFSYDLWRAFCHNPKVPASCMDYAEGRLRDMGVSSTRLAAARGRTIPDVINDVFYGETDSITVRQELEAVRGGGIDLPGCKRDIRIADGTPDWDALEAQAMADGAAACTTNDYYIYDDWWNAHDASDFAAGKLEGFLKSRSFMKAPTEDADLGCALDVASAVGLDLLCVLLPVAGPWYDYEQMSRDDREQRYESIRSTVSDHGLRIADLSGEEYTPYFTCDGTHLGWTGWLAVERAIYEFAQEG
ncbi:MAG: D-alanyl-lipoteichoic acid biosynthesis protein DltD [Atopobiaceae bacterium]|nr:D-alanyl-lipoteichoic acid biosynthesis protein DltD [Atopobiaceae bacterium]MCI2208171.1 D-alanyl-lipoteichoic acid biosynthesis protein DltD [Atopobiaceae bacterium]